MSSGTSEPETREALELERLAEELRQLRRPFWRQPTRWVPLATAVMALIGTLVISIVNVENASSRVEIAERDLKDIEAELEALQDSYERQLALYNEAVQNTKQLTRALSKMKEDLLGSGINPDSVPIDRILAELFPREQANLIVRVESSSIGDVKLAEALYVSQWGYFYHCVEALQVRGDDLVRVDFMSYNEAYDWASPHLSNADHEKVFQSRKS